MAPSHQTLVRRQIDLFNLVTGQDDSEAWGIAAFAPIDITNQ